MLLSVPFMPLCVAGSVVNTIAAFGALLAYRSGYYILISVPLLVIVVVGLILWRAFVLRSYSCDVDIS